MSAVDEVLAFLDAHAPATLDEIAGVTGLDVGVALDAVVGLVDAGRVDVTLARDPLADRFGPAR